MTDRKKVIKGLEKVSYYFKSMLRVGYQGNADIYREHRESVKMAIALLKEQEAVEPEVEVLNEIDRLYRCPRCHKHLLYEKQRCCDQCGQAVKWE